ncbi:hypothetical protein CM49_00994 [Paenibacillus sp. P1XP2]|nr:hypothetical protein CM49_00994 [Paenibacillus sp. P1XP2]
MGRDGAFSGKLTLKRRKKAYPAICRISLGWPSFFLEIRGRGWRGFPRRINGRDPEITRYRRRCCILEAGLAAGADFGVGPIGFLAVINVVFRHLFLRTGRIPLEQDAVFQRRNLQAYRRSRRLQLRVRTRNGLARNLLAIGARIERCARVDRCAGSIGAPGSVIAPLSPGSPIIPSPRLLTVALGADSLPATSTAVT